MLVHPSGPGKFTSRPGIQTCKMNRLGFQGHVVKGKGDRQRLAKITSATDIALHL